MSAVESVPVGRLRTLRNNLWYLYYRRVPILITRYQIDERLAAEFCAGVDVGAGRKAERVRLKLGIAKRLSSKVRDLWSDRIVIMRRSKLDEIRIAQTMLGLGREREAPDGPVVLACVDGHASRVTSTGRTLAAVSR